MNQQLRVKNIFPQMNADKHGFRKQNKIDYFKHNHLWACNAIAYAYLQNLGSKTFFPQMNTDKHGLRKK